ncbi:HET-domain-containing protein [Podospora fimiseda]|uniref:HET-domain-containing protein n=1 Tax=Podospora fimiseda TaxID=252190 RepID=A0AAN7H819_9PEZI|nr:HET-domain-containing protein [Podospora fimiseda]
MAEFLGDDIPPFAILSHTWGKEEKGIEKVLGACAQAAEDGFKYIWIDTCCIDKSSSAELSEAINSMYQWYGDADVCYAFLSDVTSDEDPHEEDSSFRESRWFTRGWTLQELIAPPIVVFYDCNWVEIGTRSSLQSLCVEITQINAEYFDTMNLSQFSAAQKMSWAASRETTRIDMAYSLLGLFGINMPLLYGEGAKAFIRLQEEILRLSEDDSLFCHRSIRKAESPTYKRIPSLLAHQESLELQTSPARIVSYEGNPANDGSCFLKEDHP